MRVNSFSTTSTAATVARRSFRPIPSGRGYIFFYEYFHGDNDGAGLGASHRTGWTGLIARIMPLYEVVDPQVLLKAGVARHMSSAA
jgi:hypothetical protein